MLEQALDQVKNVIQSVLPDLPQVPSEPARPSPLIPETTYQGGVLHVRTEHFAFNLSEFNGGRLENLTNATGQITLLGKSSHALVNILESGGLWRMGNEFRGGQWHEINAPLPPTRLEIGEQGTYLRISWQTMLEGEAIDQTMWVSRTDPLLYFQLQGRAPKKHTLLLRHALPYTPTSLRMENPGGVVTRPLARVYDHPFWPAQRFFHLPNPLSGPGLALLLRHPTAIAADAKGKVEIVALRNATQERAFGVMPLLGMPIPGHERERTAFRYALSFPSTPSEINALSSQSRGLLHAPWASSLDLLADHLDPRLLTLDSDQVFITALKPASRGTGLILRLYAPSLPERELHLHFTGLHPQQAWLCDARERDLQPVELQDGDLTLRLTRTLTTLRLLVDKS